MKNAVIGISINFKPSDIKNFILSFRQVNQRDDIVLFVDAGNIDLLKKAFVNYGVTFKNFYFHEFVDTPIHNTRYVKYLEFLMDHDEYSHVFFCDTKDVIFQRDPFVNLPRNYIWLFQEDSGIKIADDVLCNSWWIYAAYGQNALNALALYPIICSGTIMGSRPQMLELLQYYKAQLSQIKQENFDAFKNTILDQAIVNVFARSQHPLNQVVEIKVNGDTVGTLAASLGSHRLPPPADQILINDTTIGVNSFIPSIIHQYDRAPVLKDLYDQKYQM